MAGPACAKPKRLRFGEGRPAEGQVPAMTSKGEKRNRVDGRDEHGHGDLSE
jgi:hypothetical protein